MISSPLLPSPWTVLCKVARVGFWRARASQNRAALRAEAFFTLAREQTSGGSSMRTVTVRLPAAGVSAALAAMREWLDRNRYEPTKFNYDQDEGGSSSFRGVSERSGR